VSILAGRTKSRFSHILNSVIIYPMDDKVAVEVPTYKGRLNIKFEDNCGNRFQDMSEQNFMFFLCFSSSFRTLEKLQTCTPIFQKFSTLVGILGQLFVPILVGVIIDYLCKTKIILRHAYRVNR